MARGGERTGSSASDEEWERFLRESVEGVADAPREPSARDRGSRPGTAPAPSPWRAATPPRPAGRKRTGWYVAGFVASVALLAVAVAPGPLLGVFGRDSRPSATATEGPEEERPSSAPPAEAGRATLAEPFRGSPAERWADGAAGITVPEAKATGWMSRAEVTRALERSRDFLVASSLDAKVLRGGHPAAAIALLNPRQQDVREYLDTAFRAPSESTDPLLLFSRFRPGQARLVGDVVKTRGRLSFEEGERGALRITADVTFVYPVAPAGGGDEVVRTIVRREVVMSWDDPAKVRTEPGTFSLVSYKLDMTNGGCGTPTGWFEPPFGAGTADAGAGPAVDPYDRSAPVTAAAGTSGGGDCDATATRS